MSRSVQEELLSILWFILALLLWRFEYKTLSILVLFKAGECIVCSIVFAIIYAIRKRKAKQALKGKDTGKAGE